MTGDIPHHIGPSEMIRMCVLFRCVIIQNQPGQADETASMSLPCASIPAMETTFAQLPVIIIYR
jgi:hypothetical protein